MSTNSATALEALCSSLVAITTTVSALRFYARRVQRIRPGADDWLILPSYLTFLGMVTCALLGTHKHQFGYPATQVAAAHLTFKLEASLVVSLDVLSAASLGLTRISALLFYRRIFCVTGRTTGLAAVITIGIAIIALWMAAFIILPPLQCGPDLSVWGASATVRAAHCTRGNQIVNGFCISDLVIETAVIALPIPRILALKISLKRRLAVLFVFLTAFVSLGAVITRLVLTVKVLDGDVKDLSEANTTETFMWILEAGFALISVSLPSLWWLRQKVRPEKVLARVKSVMSLSSMRTGASGELSRKSREEQYTTTGQKRGIDYDGNGSCVKLPLSPQIGLIPYKGANRGNLAASEGSVESFMHTEGIEGRKISNGREYV